jgi:hypothetical protein
MIFEFPCRGLCPRCGRRGRAGYPLGLVVESRLESRVRHLIDSLMQRIPFVGTLYNVTKRFVAIVDRKNQDGLKSMSRCFFGGEEVRRFSDYCRCPSRSRSAISNIMWGSSRVRRCRSEILGLRPGKMGQASGFWSGALMGIDVSMGVTSPQAVD